MSRGLGKGLNALITSNMIEEEEHVLEIPVADIRPNPYQPRKEFESSAIEELAQSIKEHGIIQPLIVRKSIKGYELVAGERRLRAAKSLGLKKVAAVVKDYSDQQLMEIALIENLQRENLNPLEEAEAYEKLISHHSYTQEQLAKKIGKSRPHVANMLRLLQLPEQIRKMVSASDLSMGHARALLGVEKEELQLQLAKEAVKKGLSVRQLEELVKQANVSRETSKKKPLKKEPQLIQLEERLRSRLGTSVKIKKGTKRGKIEIDFYSQEDLQRILEILEQE
ncbi:MULTISPECIES: ParB/RepB/Spo0J family partition protein [Brevibacillus]|jgi:ParB family transcriptional regulator, chromosome partitioning protein|uniref:Stage 0 sporulation protein J n=1 Tax=Brevibacillus borstelensis AK1 TaxID=1300222 RepID=M8DGT0_9BACL|nr:ParB/RepB/Spo0J family partition protein [Brevibacillus borstelensis]EMT52683.1 stage 0 sporulation protein J [Brevibacillus borstelensis AK1]KKX55045.1 stage 0 sporulation protein J [Brevibacillus borstelensis cifa_chp40]MCM3472320.1 ParB/RepB/Spo0J family partition protein [Brevibacillus borstelensis]MCM3625046.1 ParB/RepB/Spo0J family partition protein [Brevibacillus borstelensis]MED1873468.1 ParB/RepB/Spo0J family partition protein [Brevibacillus borstelensis]